VRRLEESGVGVEEPRDLVGSSALHRIEQWTGFTHRLVS
jgi:hypothetical protein